MFEKAQAALKRIKQETCPCTICPDFDKEECLEIIEKALLVGELYESFYVSNVSKEMEKKLFAFEIIKRDIVFKFNDNDNTMAFDGFKIDEIKDYRYYYQRYDTETYKRLKEVLC